MRLSSLVKALRPGGRAPDDPRLAELAKRIEERAEIATLDAHAYADTRIAALAQSPPETGREIEQRARLATQEAKAYADSAVYGLSMALRGMSGVMLRLSHRVDTCEEALSERDRKISIDGLDADLRDIGARLADLEAALRAIDGQVSMLMEASNARQSPGGTASCSAE